MSLPIPDNVVEAAASGQYEYERQNRLTNSTCGWIDLFETVKDLRRREASAALQAALVAWGARMEPAVFPPGVPYTPTHQRLVTAWTPVDGDS